MLNLQTGHLIAAKATPEAKQQRLVARVAQFSSSVSRRASSFDGIIQRTTFKAPVLSRLCPVEAYLVWTTAAQLTAGPVFRGIDR